MRINLILFLLLLIPGRVLAQSEHPEFFHAFRLEGDSGHSQSGTYSTWDLDGWAGGDYNRLWIKSEGTLIEDNAEEAELWGMYSRNVAEFWDAQAGVRYDFEPESTTYFVIGVTGLAPYYFETEAHLFLSDEANVSGRLREEVDILITQKLVAQPYAEATAYASDVPDANVGAGLAEGEFGLQLRYEFVRKFAPYLNVSYQRKFGETAGLARDEGERDEDFVYGGGLRLMF